MPCQRPSSSIKDRLETLTTALLRSVSTFARPVAHTLDPARGSSYACAPSLSLSSSTGNRARDLGRRSETVGMALSCEAPDDARFFCVSTAVTGSGPHIFARVELRLGVADALAYTPFRPVVDGSVSATPGSSIGGGLEWDGVGW